MDLGSVPQLPTTLGCQHSPWHHFDPCPRANAQTMPEHSLGTVHMNSLPMRSLTVAAYFRMCGREEIYFYQSGSKNRLILFTSIAMDS